MTVSVQLAFRKVTAETQNTEVILFGELTTTSVSTYGGQFMHRALDDHYVGGKATMQRLSKIFQNTCMHPNAASLLVVPKGLPGQRS